MHFERILIATDFSPASYSAFELSSYSRKMEGSEIILLHTVDFYPPFVEMPGWSDDQLFAEYRESCSTSAKNTLAELAAKYFHGESIRTEVIVSVRPTADEICTFAAKENCSLIVMGSRGHTALGGLFVGSTVQRVLLQTKCPVLIVPPADRAAKA